MRRPKVGDREDGRWRRQHSSIPSRSAGHHRSRSLRDQATAPPRQGTGCASTLPLPPGLVRRRRRVLPPPEALARRPVRPKARDDDRDPRSDACGVQDAQRPVPEPVPQRRQRGRRRQRRRRQRGGRRQRG